MTYLSVYATEIGVTNKFAFYLESLLLQMLHLALAGFLRGGSLTELVRALYSSKLMYIDLRPQVHLMS